MIAKGPRQDGKVPGPRWRRRTPASRVLFSLTATLFAAIGAVLVAAFVVTQAIYAPGPLTEKKTVIIEQGQRTPEIGARLEQDGVISNRRLFAAAAYLTSTRAGPLKPGEYEFEISQSMADVLALIRSGRAVLHKLTIPEGWTTEQVLKRMAEHPALAGEIGAPPKEGELLPDTYLFHRGFKREALLEQMKSAQTKLLDELWDGRAPGLPYSTKEEAITLASIVEKETGVAAERGRVAAVFVNRLKKKMRLQSDPTIIYGIAGGKGRLDRPILRSDIETKTDYNTYRIDGLPPGPIANPGRDSIAATLNPSPGNFLYFVADGTGGHVFAASLAEHRENVQRWREIEKARGGDDEALTAEVEAKTGEATAEAKPAPSDEPKQPEAQLPEPTQKSEVATAETANASESDSAGASVPPPEPKAEAPPPPASETKPAAGQEAKAPESTAETPAPTLAPEQPDAVAKANEQADQNAAAKAKPQAEQDATPKAEQETAAVAAPAPQPIVKPIPKPTVREVKPGSVIKVADRLVPIPKRKPKRN